MDEIQRIEIISDYGDVLANRKGVYTPESALPYPKELIREALSQELINPSVPALRDHVETGYSLLESFLSDEDYQIYSESEQMITTHDIGSMTPEEAKKLGERRTELDLRLATALLHAVELASQGGG